MADDGAVFAVLPVRQLERLTPLNPGFDVTAEPRPSRKEPARAANRPRRKSSYFTM